MSSWGGTPVYKGYGNAVSYELYADVVTEEPLDLGDAYTIAVYIGDVAYADSDANPDVVTAERRPDGVWVTHIKLGLVPGIEAGEHAMRVAALTIDNPKGVVLLDGARAVVRE